MSAFLQHSNAVAAHDIDGIDRITAPTLITCGRRDALTSTRFAEPMKAQIRNAELVVFENCSHAPLYENVQAFNEQTLRFLQRQSGAGGACARSAILQFEPETGGDADEREADVGGPIQHHREKGIGGNCRLFAQM